MARNFYHRNQAKKFAKHTLSMKALSGHFLEFAPENIHLTCRRMPDIDNSAR